MSDDELSDCMEELQELIAEYETKEKESNNNVKPATKKINVSATLKDSAKPKSSMEVPMDKILFGDKAGFLKNLAKAVGEDGQEKNSHEESVGDATVKRKAKKRKPVWADADDEEIQFGDVKRETKYTGPLDHLRKDKSYKEYLTARFTSIVPQPKWASLDRKDEQVDSDDDELLHTVGFLAKSSGNNLTAHNINCKRLKDLNRASYAEGAITSIQFHPTSTAALVSGLSGIATIYSIDGTKNEKLHNVCFQNFPIKCAKMKPCGTKAIFGSTRRHYYLYDLLKAQETRYVLPREVTTLRNFKLSACGRYMAVAGRFGALHLFDVNSQELLHTFMQNGTVSGICFTADSRKLICNSESSTVSIFSLRQQRLEHSFIDDGCILGRVIDLSPSERLFATGSNEGVVNVYDFDKVQATRSPLPEKSFLNLTTAISDVKFNHSSELLAMASMDVNSAVKLAHFPSATVYANFPTFKADLGKIRTLEFSPASGYFALGNHNKATSLFRLKHFQNY